MWQLSLGGSKENLEAVENSLTAVSVASTLIESRKDSAQWTLTIISDVRIEDQFTSPITLISNEPLQQRNWVAENRASFKPLEVDQFYIYPSSLTASPITSHINLCIDASTAFGTGHHETTSGCLKALNWLVEQKFTPNHFLDIGTGTGILAMAAARLFNTKGVATDNDPEAIVRADQNKKINDLDQSIYVTLDHDLTSREVNFFKPYPLIIANILLQPLIELSSIICENLESNGYLILSGILTHQVEMLQKCYEICGLKCVHQLDQGEWSIVIFKK